MSDREVDHQKYFEVLIQSEALGLTPTQKKILQYIADKTFANEPLNELLIASEVLHKDHKFDPSLDTSIRVHISNIRKKLDQYFQTTGKQEPLILKIPKGQYQLKITDRSKSSKSPVLSLNLIYLIIVILLIAAFIFQFFYFKNKISESGTTNNSHAASTFWTSMISNNKPVLIIYHDIFFYDKINEAEGERYIIYNEKIDNEEELDSLANTQTAYRFSKSFDYVRYRSMKQLLEIHPILYSGGKNVEVRLLNELKPSDLTMHNIIFVGKHRKMGIFQSLLEKLGFNFSFFPHQIAYHSQQTDSVFSYEMEGQWKEFHNDLGIIAKIPGPDENEIILLTSLHAVGNGLTQVVKLVSEPGNFESLQSELPMKNLPPYFYALIKVSGYEEAGFSHQVLHFGEIEEDQDLWIE